jgi:hypothetical protein
MNYCPKFFITISVKHIVVGFRSTVVHSLRNYTLGLCGWVCVLKLQLSSAKKNDEDEKRANLSREDER